MVHSLRIVLRHIAILAFLDSFRIRREGIIYRLHDVRISGLSLYGSHVRKYDDRCDNSFRTKQKIMENYPEVFAEIRTRVSGIVFYLQNPP